MSAASPWTDLEQRECAAQLYAALTALVGEVEPLRLTGASLSWRTPSGVQGHWREERGVLTVGRIITDLHGEGWHSAYLGLVVSSVGDDEARVGLAHPTVYYQHSRGGLMVGHDPDTPMIYEAALALLTQLAAEVDAMLRPARVAEEETGDAPA